MPSSGRTAGLLLGLSVLFWQPTVSAKVIGVPEIFQLQTMWCWAANTHCVLEYYGNPMVQCEIVEYSFSNSNCCESPGSH